MTVKGRDGGATGGEITSRGCPMRSSARETSSPLARRL
eukprot:CAMPEP_0184712426 /NCGR_PEP_ID=MMETSP0314-20130426/2973_1 /TAXON_ID=38298 /ORGANISM="Rhodella maculata, Strain CCMP 736" /LENGTH=37 /DNA_ID= /DNA_START= /DNA_END= /DNA_ORIENTATION=